MFLGCNFNLNQPIFSSWYSAMFHGKKKHPQIWFYLYFLVNTQVLFAIIPPAQYFGGWPAFLISLAFIGFLTAIIGDLASIFGCLIGLEDGITAITLVALGTSMPDTFASKTAAVMEKTADSSVGNVNGSNSVNVFLGLGLPWMIASIYWAAKVNSRIKKKISSNIGSTKMMLYIYICLYLMHSVNCK